MRKMVILSKQELITYFDAHRAKNEQIIKKLDEMLTKFVSYDKKRKLKKTGAAATMLMGSTVALAPATGAISLTAGLGIASAIVAGGTAVSIHTDQIDNKKAIELNNELKELELSREEIVQNEVRVIKCLREVVNGIVKQDSVSVEEAITRTIYAHSQGSITISDNWNGSVSTGFPEELRRKSDYYSFENLLSNNEKEEIFVKYVKLYNKSTIANTTAAAANISTGLLHQNFALFFYILSSATVVLTFANLAVLIHEWYKVHPTIEKIVKAREQLKNEISMCRNYIDLFYTITSDVRAKQVDSMISDVKALNAEYAELQKKINDFEEGHQISSDMLNDSFARIEAQLNLIKKD